MGKKITGALLQVLQSSPTAWYQGRDGIRAYYEQPSTDTDGVFVVNGKRICRLVFCPEELYWYRPTPNLMRKIVSHGIDLDSGWTGSQEVQGEHINEAMKQSSFSAVRHHDGIITLQKIDEQHAMIFVSGREHWRVRISIAHNALEELGVVTWSGWYPVQHDLLHVTAQAHRRQLL